MSKFRLQLPHVLMRCFHIVGAQFMKDFLQIRNRLLSDSDEIFERVVLMLFESGEKHFLNFVLVRPLLFRSVLLLIFVLDEIRVVGHGLVSVYDPDTNRDEISKPSLIPRNTTLLVNRVRIKNLRVDMLNGSPRLLRVFYLLLFHLHVVGGKYRATFGPTCHMTL